MAGLLAHLTPTLNMISSVVILPMTFMCGTLFAVDSLPLWAINKIAVFMGGRWRNGNKYLGMTKSNRTTSPAEDRIMGPHQFLKLCIGAGILPPRSTNSSHA